MAIQVRRSPIVLQTELADVQFGDLEVLRVWRVVPAVDFVASELDALYPLDLVVTSILRKYLVRSTCSFSSDDASVVVFCKSVLHQNPTLSAYVTSTSRRRFKLFLLRGARRDAGTHSSIRLSSSHHSILHNSTVNVVDIKLILLRPIGVCLLTDLLNDSAIYNGDEQNSRSNDTNCRPIVQQRVGRHRTGCL